MGSFIYFAEKFLLHTRSTVQVSMSLITYQNLFFYFNIWSFKIAYFKMLDWYPSIFYFPILEFALYGITFYVRYQSPLYITLLISFYALW
jgi:hypothetical protein